MAGVAPIATLAAAPHRDAASTRTLYVTGWIVLALLLAIGVPLLLCMPPWADVTMYDVAAQTLLRGGVMYRDVFDTNLPGAIWVQTIVRALFGWRYDTLRAFDLLVVSAVLWLLLEWIRELGARRTTRVWVAVSVYAYYLFQSEAIHCQRDVWMLLPVLLALRIRRRQVRALGTRVPRSVVLASTCEGLLWGAAIWIKPFALVPAMGCWLTSVRLSRRMNVARRDLLLDAAGLFAGGTIAGVLGIAWLVRTGAFPYFVDTMFAWNRDYAAHVYGFKARRRMIVASVKYNMPWILVHAAAAPVAFAALLHRSRETRGRLSRAAVAGPLLGALYWGWLVQAALLQPRLHDYQVASMLLIAMPLGLAIGLRRIPHRRVRRVIIALAVAFVAFRHPVFRLDRLALLPDAVSGGNTVALRDRLSLMSLPNSNGLTNWTDLTRVAEFLASQRAGDGEVLCFNESTHPLYLMLNLTPAFRFIQSNLVVEVLESHRDRLMEELALSRARFVVTDLSSILASPDTPTSAVPEPWNERYPWTLPVVFRAGRYFVHEPAGPVTRFWR